MPGIDRWSKRLHAVLGLWAVYCALLVSATFIDIFTYVEANNYDNYE